MESALKQRLVGAVVLVALGVIFIPILLERSEEDTRLSMTMEIPPKPDIAFEDRLASPPKPLEQKPLQPFEEAIAPVRQQPAKASDKEPQSSTGVPASKAPDKQPQSSSGTPASSETKPAVPVVKDQSAGKPDDSKQAKSTSRKELQAPVPIEEWVVQAGSFSRETNAQVLVDKLKAGGFAAFVESASTQAGPVYRVRIGPVKEREAAEKLVGRLQSSGYRGMVMSYP